MESVVLYHNECGKVLSTKESLYELHFKTEQFLLSMEQLMLLNGKLKKSPFVVNEYAPVPDYIYVDIGNNDKARLEKKCFVQLKDLVEGAVSIIGIEEDLKKII